ncbi:sgt1 and cs domain containing protein [Zymoseptoria brevis]|uniref:Sgt1 and cs domain containing protein n=1 Tax=Zymoseptoria brevis TaxID=1047168 RepID=A0A0F4G4J6_9PEZI|nr:sgt1 and cs domain containing protein [Zymoseptoria brevis]
MASQFALRGKQALDIKDYNQAIEHFTAAIKDAPSSPEFYLQRAIAHTRAKNYQEALDDSEQAVINGQKRAKREAILQAQFRRGIALHQLSRYSDATFILQLIQSKLGETEKKDYQGLDLWLHKSKAALEKLDEDDEKRKCTITETPTPRKTSTPVGGSTATMSPPVAPPTSTSHITPNPPQTAPDKIRHEFYQTTENVYFTLLAKGVPKDKAQVEITSRALSISFPLNNGADYDFTIEPLFGAVQVEKCITRILPSKIEIILVKATPGQKWATLEAADSVTNDEDEESKRAVFAESDPASAPAYPTSSKTGPKNWDKIVDGDDDDEIEGGDETNHFFKKLFKDASPEMQRAMMKSYTESNGTSLSTNWDEVSKGKVETIPPSGMEAKEWTK